MPDVGHNLPYCLFARPPGSCIRGHEHGRGGHDRSLAGAAAPVQLGSSGSVLGRQEEEGISWCCLC
jgi:hypothetical protein